MINRLYVIHLRPISTAAAARKLRIEIMAKNRSEAERYARALLKSPTRWEIGEE